MQHHDEMILRRLHALRHTDQYIADVIGCHVETVRRTRRALGLEQTSERLKITKADIDTLRTLHASGMTDVEIANVLGCTKSNVTYHRHKLGLAANRRQKAVSDEDLMQMADAGIPCSEIADQVGLSRELVTRRVQRLFKALGRPPGNFNRRKSYRRRTKFTRPYDDKMIALLKQGLSTQQTADQLGISRRTVLRRLQAIFGTTNVAGVTHIQTARYLGPSQPIRGTPTASLDDY